MPAVGLGESLAVTRGWHLVRTNYNVAELMGRLDTLNEQERSFLMSRIRTKDTGPELTLRKALWARGLRYITAAGYRSRYGRHLTGRPDIIFTRQRVAIFVDGCFWHGCPLGCKGVPGTNKQFWTDKIEANKRRDAEVNATLGETGWQVRRYWEHDIKTVSGLYGAVDEISALIDPAE